jgi:hypothetical protein
VRRYIGLGLEEGRSRSVRVWNLGGAVVVDGSGCFVILGEAGYGGEERKIERQGGMGERERERGACAGVGT